MTQIISVRFNEFGKAYFFDPGRLEVENGKKVIVETAKGLEYGTCIRGNHEVDDDIIIHPLRPVIRIATSDDENTYKAGKEKEIEAFAYCRDRIVYFGLDMKLISVEYGFEGSKIMFFFTSDGRVDFRELVKDLAGKYKTRVELRQVGVRDEAKMLGGLGVCGKQFCCSQFLTEFHPVSIKMAKTQGLSLNPSKISGTCGRLMCCLKYEEAAYEDLVVKAPKIGAFVETPYGKGSVININILRGLAKVRLEDGNDTTLKTCLFDEISILGGKGRRAEYVAAKAEGKLEEAGFSISPPSYESRALDHYASAPVFDSPVKTRAPSYDRPRYDALAADKLRKDKQPHNRQSDVSVSDKSRKDKPHREKQNNFDSKLHNLDAAYDEDDYIEDSFKGAPAFEKKQKGGKPKFKKHKNHRKNKQ
ncbi:MAG: stage 0 sporulation family protein [Oscillospiraceae bacterium]|nr:stage 0 sporulation family protein [Oscillospiraceae bacterium]